MTRRGQPAANGLKCDGAKAAGRSGAVCPSSPAAVCARETSATPVLLVLLFNGVGGALLAMTALGVSLAAVSMECNDDDEASQVARSALDEDFRAESMQKNAVWLLHACPGHGRFAAAGQPP